MTIQEYVDQLNTRYKTGISREHSYRGDLKLLLGSLLPELLVTNEPTLTDIGGYQPAEKWLKCRRDRELSFEEIQHYQRIIVALLKTDRIMGEVDRVFEIHNNEENML